MEIKADAVNQPAVLLGVSLKVDLTKEEANAFSNYLISGPFWSNSEGGLLAEKVQNAIGRILRPLGPSPTKLTS